MADRNLNAQLVIGANVAQAVQGLNQLQTQMSAISKAGVGLMRILGSAGVAYAGIRFDRAGLDRAISMNAEMAHLATTVNDGAQTTAHLNEVQSRANELMATGVETNVDLAESYYAARSAGLNHVEAMAAMNAANTLVLGSTKSVAEAQASMVNTTRTLGEMAHNFLDPLKAVNPQLQHFTDLISLLQRRHNFMNIGELTQALEYINPTAAGLRISPEATTAILGVLAEAGMRDSRAGTVGAETLKALTAPKMRGLDIFDAAHHLDVGRTLAQVQKMMAPLPPDIQKKILTERGFEGEALEGMMALIKAGGQYNDILKEGMGSAGSAAEAAAARANTAEVQIAILSNRWSRFGEIVGASLLGPLNTLLGYLKPIVLAMDAFMQGHAGVAQLTAAFIGLGSALIIAGGAIQLLGIGTTITKTWAAAQWLLNAAMAANPIGMVILGVAALAGAAYLVYEHWAAVKAFFVTLGTDMYAAGKNLVMMIGHGIEAAAMYPVHAIASIARAIRAHLPFSPAEVGPLKDLHRVRIVETIAATMSPAPVIAQMRRVAAAAAVAVPLAVMPVGAHGGALAMHGNGSGGHVTNNIHLGGVRVTVSGSGKPADVRKAVEDALEASTDKIATALQRRQFNRDRGNY